MIRFFDLRRVVFGLCWCYSVIVGKIEGEAAKEGKSYFISRWKVDLRFLQLLLFLFFVAMGLWRLYFRTLPIFFLPLGTGGRVRDSLKPARHSFPIAFAAVSNDFYKLDNDVKPFTLSLSLRSLSLSGFLFMCLYVLGDLCFSQS